MPNGTRTEALQQDDAASQPPVDSESMIDAMLSPQDGTFGRRYVPDEVHVQNPDHLDAQAANKEQEAREQQEHSHEGHRRDAEISQWASSSRGTWRGQPFQPDPMPREERHPSTSMLHVAPSVADDQASVMTHPPPAYSDIAHSISGRSRPPTVHYNTMGNENERFFPAGTPQDLGGGARDLETEPLLGGSGGGQPSRLHRLSRQVWEYSKTFAKLLVIALVLLLGLGFIMSVADHLGPERVSVPIAVDPDNRATAPLMCPLATVTAQADVKLKGPDSFDFVERSIAFSNHYNTEHSSLQVHGDLEIHKDEKLSGGDIHMTFSFHSSDEDVLQGLQMYSGEKDHSVQLFIPEWTGKRHKGQQPCLVVKTTIWVAPDTDLDSFSVGTEHLNIGWGSDADFSARNTVLEAALGNIWFHGGDQKSTLKGRELIAETRTGSVRGDYPLMDLLSIKTTTGSIDAVVVAKEAESKHVRPAELQVETWTGSIKLDTLMAGAKSLPQRDYRTSIKTHTGSVTAHRLAHGSHTDISASTSQVRAVLHPQGPLSEQSNVVVRTNTGSIDIAVAPHARDSSANMTHLSGDFSTTTGSVHIVHPLQWQGSVSAETGIGGSISVDWPGLARQNGDGGGFQYLGKIFYGRKGKGDGTVQVSTRTGSITLEGADVP